MLGLIVQLFFIAFFLNLLYELLHSVLYTTCLQMPLKRYVLLILKASTVDAVWITSFYLITFAIFKNENPLNNPYQLALFAGLSICWAYGWEAYSLKNKRWEYSKTMPLIGGVGITPLVQLFLTGLSALYLAFNF